MSSPQTAAPASVETIVATEADVVEFVHRLGGDVDIAAFDDAGQPAPFGMVIPISDDEVAVHVHPGQVHRLVATLSPPEDDEDDEDDGQPAREGMHVRR